MTDDRKVKRTPPPGELSYAEFFGNIRMAGDLLADDSKQAWSTTIPDAPQHHEYVVWLGCQVLRTAHLAETLNDVLNHLAVDHATLGGPSNCCGVVHHRRGDQAISDNLTRQTVKKFDAFTPEQMLVWCPSCDNHLRSKPDEFQTPTTRGRRSVTSFLAERIVDGRALRSEPVTVAVHTHHGFAEQDADAAALRQLLGAIPGLRLVEVPPVEGVGRHCAGNVVTALGKDEYLARMRAWIAAAQAAGAERIVSLYHSCHRQMVVAQVETPEAERLPVENYLTLVARSLGLPSREDRYARYMNGDVEQAVAELAPQAERLKLDPARARRALVAQFGSKQPS